MLSNTYGLSSMKRLTEVEKRFSGELFEILKDDLTEQSGGGFWNQDVVTSLDKWFHGVGGQKRANPEINDVLIESQENKAIKLSFGGSLRMSTQQWSVSSGDDGQQTDIVSNNGRLNGNVADVKHEVDSNDLSQRNRLKRRLKQQRRRRNRKLHKGPVVPTVPQEYLSHDKFLIKLKSNLDNFNAFKNGKVHLAFFTHALMGLPVEQEKIEQFSRGIKKLAGSEYPCLDMNVRNCGAFKQFFAGKNGNFLSDRAISIVLEQIVKCSEQLRYWWNPVSGYRNAFQDLLQKFRLSGAFERAMAEQERCWVEREKAGYAHTGLGRKILAQKTLVNQSYGTRRHIDVDPYERGFKYPEVLKFVPDSFNKEINGQTKIEDSISSQYCPSPRVGRKPILLIISDESFRNAVVDCRTFLKSSFTTVFDISIICIPRFCFTEKHLVNIFHIREIRRLREGDFLWINIGLNNCFIDEESKERFIWRDKQLENFYKKSI